MDNLRLSHVVFPDAPEYTLISSIPKDNEEKLYRSTSSILVTAGKEEPHTSSSFQLYSLLVALVTFALGPPAANSAVAAASYFLLGSKHYGSILSGFLRLITFSSAAVRLELGLSKVSLPSLVDRSQLILCLDSLGLVTTVVTTWMIPQFILAWAAIRCQADTHAIVMPDSSSLAILGIAALSFSSIILEGYILRHSVHTQQSIEKAEIRLTE